MFDQVTPIQLGVAGSLVAALATGLGGAMILIRRRWDERGRHRVLAWAAGLLLGASVLSLGLPAGRQLAPRLGDVGLVATLMGGLLLGGLGLRAVAAVSHRVGTRHGHGFFLLAMTLHNLPEGLAVGTSLGAASPMASLPVLLGILLHAFPQGLAVASAAVTWGWSPLRGVGAAILTGLGGALAGVLGAILTERFLELRPFILLCTAGGMIELVRTEILPTLRAQTRVAWLPVVVVSVFLISLLAALVRL